MATLVASCQVPPVTSLFDKTRAAEILGSGLTNFQILGSGLAM